MRIEALVASLTILFLAGVNFSGSRVSVAELVYRMRIPPIEKGFDYDNFALSKNGRFVAYTKSRDTTEIDSFEDQEAYVYIYDLVKDQIRKLPLKSQHIAPFWEWTVDHHLIIESLNGQTDDPMNEGAYTYFQYDPLKRTIKKIEVIREGEIHYGGVVRPVKGTETLLLREAVRKNPSWNITIY